METGLIGGAVALALLLLTIWVIRTLCDVVISLGFLAAVAIPFLMGLSGEMTQEEVILFAVAFGILMPVITMPLWPISKIMGGNDKETKGRIKELRNDEEQAIDNLQSIVHLYGADIDELKNQIKNIEDNKIVKKSNKALTQLDSLKEKGLITEDDYEIKKKEITDR